MSLDFNGKFAQVFGVKQQRERLIKDLLIRKDTVIHVERCVCSAVVCVYICVYVYNILTCNCIICSYLSCQDFTTGDSKVIEKFQAQINAVV